MLNLRRGRFRLLFFILIGSFFCISTTILAAARDTKTWVSTITKNQYVEVEITADADNLDSKGTYNVTFTAKRGSQNKYEGDITALVVAEKNVCVEGKGQTVDKGIQYAKQMNSTDKHCFST